MSRLMIVLCTAAIFGSALATVLDSLNTKDKKLWLDDAIKKIDDRIQEAHRQVEALGDQPSAKNFEIIAQYKDNVTKQFDSAIDAITRDMQRSPVNFTESKCKIYFDEYQQLANKVQDQLDDLIIRVLIPVVDQYLNATIDATELQKRLTNLEVDDTIAAEFFENNNDAVNIDVDYAIKNIDEAVARFTKLNDGSLTEEAVLKNTDWLFYIENETDVFNSFINCALTKRNKNRKPAVSPPQ